MPSSQTIPQEAVEAAIYAFAQFGIEFRAPWQCDLDDLERERYEALCAALAAAAPHLQQGAGWRTMESAPKDGTRILCGRFSGDKRDANDGYQCVDWYRQPESREGYVGFGHFNKRYWPATHWMPLPPSPSSREGA